MENAEYPVTKWGKLLGLSTSAYYGWLISKNERDKRNKNYKNAIAKIFTDSHNTYDPDRVCGVLRRLGYTASYKRVSTTIKRMGLSSIHNRRRQRSLTDSRNAKGKKYPNLIRDLDVFKPLQVITSDISYIRTSEGFKYLCKIKDIATGVVLAHANDAKYENTIGS